MKGREIQKKRKKEHSGNWKKFWKFFKQAKLNWGLIALTLAVSVLYYGVVSFIQVLRQDFMRENLLSLR